MPCFVALLSGAFGARAKNISSVGPHATIPTLRFEGPRYYGSDRLISPSPHHPIPHCNITARIASITTHIIPFRTVILRFKTAIPPHLMTLFRIAILRLGTIHFVTPYSMSASRYYGSERTFRNPISPVRAVISRRGITVARLDKIRGSYAPV